MSRVHWQKRRDFLRTAAGWLGAGAAATLLPKLNLMGTALAQGTSGYKALVCISLDGGNDAWNLLVPTDDSTPLPVTGRTPLSGFQATPYGWYVTSRGGLFQGNPAALGLLRPGMPRPNLQYLPSAIALDGGQYGVNPACQGLADLYNSGRLAFVANIGPLVEPLRRQGFTSFQRPPQLYSHNDQTSLWHIGGGASAMVAEGWGGRVAGRLLGLGPASGLSPCISISGQARFLVGEYPDGQPVSPYRLSTSASAPATPLGNYSAGDPAGATRRAALEAMMAATYPQAMSNAYGEIFDRSLNLSGTVNQAIAGLAANGAFSGFTAAVNAIPNTSLGQQLRQVARMIAVSRVGSPYFSSIQANRQIYYVRIGGFDTHDGQIPTAPNVDPVPPSFAYSGHQGLLQQLSQAMSAFLDAIVALDAVSGYSGVANEVVSFTMSEFARTLNSNGNGTDHAWGSVSMVMGAAQSLGGPVFGKQIVGRYPLQLLNRQYTTVVDAFGESFNRGEFLPTTAVDQLAATLARWMGVSTVDLPLIFPNIDRFAMPRPEAIGVMAQQGRVIPGLLSGVS